ncbi:sulfate adenylyltransferase subunit 1 [Actinophytocola oryzae]|uniref:sulfate adenylyltransferase n=1 Tax=Actinophytocola oryzae TaxID=502181 RepID=A0A4R7VX42_9PSEU|nr:GTP-binding protein [Actinophytocola oryzae]TDV54225.1 sulfate adenylyltransferase subunit 1 [Actinophytocola oryzae]
MSTDLLRMVTAGSVDDGKSTLVGRLLYDTKSVQSDQLEAVLRTSAERGLTDPDLSLLVDGLRAEREQGITIDVAYRYFATKRRSFVLADTPGHVQYLRNTATGASTAQHAVLLVDARKGMLPQTRRHLAVMALLGVPTITFAVNKLDLMDFSREVHESITADLVAYTRSLGYLDEDLVSVPLSALTGDNVVLRSERTPWYEGPTLLDRLESVEQEPHGRDVGLRLAVQYVVRDRATDYRGYAGQVAAGRVAVGDEVVVLPEGRTTTVAGIDTPDGAVWSADTGAAVTLRLADDLDVSRGDLLATPGRAPAVTHELDATMCWLAETPLRPGGRLRLKHGTRTTGAMVTDLVALFDEQRLTVSGAPETITAGSIARVRLRVADPLPVDDYTACKATGAFLLIDPTDGSTVAAGLHGDPLHRMLPTVVAAEEAA